ncbi:unnamed protein product, partial [Mesocestoides corti]|uniref:Radial spoke head protein 4 A n=1 Tax=Mesocestoides corti TaxID=53468 RepID=A0A0R3UEL8_MESCO
KLFNDADFDQDSSAVQDIYKIANVIRTTGEGVGSDEYVKLNLSLRDVMSDYSIENVRFWGKIFGLKSNYYIFECEPHDLDAFSDIELPGTVDDTEEVHTEVVHEDARGLEHVLTPCGSILLKQIHNFFTGNLEAAVTSYPQFPGTEANYLRAQIARISAGTQLAPEGYYRHRVEEEDDAKGLTECEENEDYTEKPVSEMTPENWVHKTAYILPQGRVTW